MKTIVTLGLAAFLVATAASAEPRLFQKYPPADPSWTAQEKALYSQSIQARQAASEIRVGRSGKSEAKAAAREARQAFRSCLARPNC